MSSMVSTQYGQFGSTYTCNELFDEESSFFIDTFLDKSHKSPLYTGYTIKYKTRGKVTIAVFRLIFSHCLLNLCLLISHTMINEPIVMKMKGINLEFCHENPKSSNNSSNRFIITESALKLIKHSGLNGIRCIIYTIVYNTLI